MVIYPPQRTLDQSPEGFDLGALYKLAEKLSEEVKPGQYLELKYEGRKLDTVHVDNIGSSDTEERKFNELQVRFDDENNMPNQISILIDNQNGSLQGRFYPPTRDGVLHRCHWGSFEDFADNINLPIMHSELGPVGSPREVLETSGEMIEKVLGYLSIQNELAEGMQVRQMFMVAYLNGQLKPEQLRRIATIILEEDGSESGPGQVVFDTSGDSN